MFTLDLHAHSRFFHGWGPRPTLFDPVGGRVAAAQARARGLDAVAFTNHDYAWTPDLAAVDTLPGIEISTTRGHVLVVGPEPPEGTSRGGLTPAEAVDLAHDHDCAAIMAHPFRNGDLPDVAAPFDAVEVNGKQPQSRAAVERLADERDLPIVGGSDAHYPFEIGRAFTRVHGDDRSPAGVVDAIREGRVEPVQAHYPIDRVLGPLYRAVHRRKGHVP